MHTSILLAIILGLANCVLSAKKHKCLGNTTASRINKSLQRRGRNARIELCSEALVIVDETIRFTAEGQQLYTRNLPSDESRAVFQLVDGFDTQGTSISTIIDASCPACSGAKISSLRIDAGRGVHGWTPDGGAVIEAGSHATVTGIEILEPRGNAAIRISGKSCSHAEIAGVDLAGWMEVSAEREIQPTNSTLEAWMEGWQTSFSDGILLEACQDSVIRNNLISNFAGASIFAMDSPRTNILDNTISMSSDRTGVAGILVDGGQDGAGLYVSDNTIHVWQGYISAAVLLKGARGAYVARNVVSASIKQAAFAFGFAFSSSPTLKAEANRISAHIYGTPGLHCPSWIDNMQSSSMVHDDSPIELDEMAKKASITFDALSLTCFVKSPHAGRKSLKFGQMPLKAARGH